VELRTTFGFNTRVSDGKRKLSDEERAESARLKAIYRRKKKSLGITQEKLAAQMGFATQGAVSHYMNSVIAMSNEVVLRFAHHLDVDPREIRPDIWESIPLQPRINGLDAEAIEFAKDYAGLSPEDREILRKTLSRLLR
jgi:transcriptional regulator with XRE-family HTH domain